MDTIIGTWRLIREEAWGSDGRAHPPFFGAMPTGLAMFNAEGRLERDDRRWNHTKV